MASYRCCVSSGPIAAGLNGDILATCRISSEYALPMPAMFDCARSTPLIWARPCALRMPSSTSTVNSGSSGSGPSRATPGTSEGERTTQIASDFFVPYSVRSKPVPSSRIIRAASGPLPRPAPGVGAVSRHRSHPARARWNSRWTRESAASPIVRSRNLPCRSTAEMVWPSRADTGGSKVLSAANDTTSKRFTSRPTRRARRSVTSACTSGSSGMHQVCVTPATRGHPGLRAARTARAARIRRRRARRGRRRAVRRGCAPAGLRPAAHSRPRPR